MKKRIAVTGLGAVTPIGIGWKAFWDAAVRGTPGTGPMTLFDNSHYEIKIAAEVKNFDPADFMLPQVFRKTDRFAQMGIAAAKMALEDSGLASRFDPENNSIPVIIGSGLGGSLFHEEQIFQLIAHGDPRKVLSSSVPRIAPNAVSAYIAMEHKLRGPNLTISTACSSGGNAIAVAADYLQKGISEVVITGGAECPISPFTYAAYQALRVLSDDKVHGVKTPRPFDISRDGFVLGEAAGILVLEDYDHAKKRGAKIYAELAGYGSNCGAFHMAAPDPSGKDAAEAMEAALRMAGAEKEKVGYINAHGTATKMNDECEAIAINKVFGSSRAGPWVSSTKSQTGHTIGAAGAIEAILTVLSIVEGIVPPTIHTEKIDPACPVNLVVKDAVKAKIQYAMSNSFGFGSNNSVLLFSKV
ncbi:MAG: beta-ketoacyl-[acyl-carrier-protein] synthase family protein [Candidatus Omnitrophota bacterium]